MAQRTRFSSRNLLRSSQPDQPGQIPRAAPVAAESHPDEAGCDREALPGEHDVRAPQKPERAPDDRAPGRANDRHGQLGQGDQRLVEQRHHPVELPREKAAVPPHVCQVAADAEVRARGGDVKRPHALGLLRRGDRVAEPTDHVGVDRVVPLLSKESDAPDRSLQEEGDSPGPGFPVGRGRVSRAVHR